MLTYMTKNALKLESKVYGDNILILTQKVVFEWMIIIFH